MSWPVKLWLMLLVAGNMIVPLFFLHRLEAQVILVTFIASAMLMILITGLTGYTRLLGLGHFLWFPLIYFLWTRLPQIPAYDFYGLWIRGVMLLNGISLVIDVLDVTRYLRGDREDMVPEL